MNTISRYEHDIAEYPSMKGPVITSAMLHLILFVVTAVGLPFVAKKPIEDFKRINVEIVDISDITQTTRIEAPAPEPEKLEEPKPTPAKKPAPPFVEPEAPKIEKKEAEPEKPKDKPKPKPKPPEEKPKEAVSDSSFESLLNNLTPDIAEEQPQAPQSQIANIGDRMTISERDAIGQQLYPCWNVPSGTKFAENLAVEIRVFMNPDGSIRDTQILDTGRYGRDPHFRAAADSANRALRNPRCTPLKYPAEKYEQLKQFVFRFDPQDML